MTSPLQTRAREALAARGVRNPDPNQVVLEMKRLQDAPDPAADLLAGFRRTVFGE